MGDNNEIEEILIIGSSDKDETVDIRSTKNKKSMPAKQVETLLVEATIEGIARYIIEKPCKNIVVLSGAGISTNSGIADMRTPGTGLYYRLDPTCSTVPYPHSVFEIRGFRKNPLALYKLIYPYMKGEFKPTLCHYFITLLQRKNILLKNYSMNGDDLEKAAGIAEDKIGQIYGSFRKFRCSMCDDESSPRWIKNKIAKGQVPKCSCGGIVKPRLFFYGEALPQLFCHSMAEDMKTCDLLIILGTTLSDEPVASMPFLVDKKCPRLFLNGSPPSRSLGFDFSSRVPKDVFWQGDCEEGCMVLVDLLGWTDDFFAIREDVLNSNVLKQLSGKSSLTNITKEC